METTGAHETFTEMDVFAAREHHLTAVVQLVGGRLEIVRHPVDGQVVAFDNPDDAFAFAVTLEIAGAESAGTVGAPPGAVHLLEPGVSALELMSGRPIVAATTIAAAA